MLRKFSEAGWFAQFSRLILKSPSINIFLFSLAKLCNMVSICSVNLSEEDEGCL